MLTVCPSLGSATEQVSNTLLEVVSNDPHGQYRANPYVRQDNTAYEMSEVRDSTTDLAAGGGGADPGDMTAFYAEVRFFPLDLGNSKFILSIS